MERRGRWDKWRGGEDGISGEGGRWDKWRGGGGGISGEEGEVGSVKNVPETVCVKRQALYQVQCPDPPTPPLLSSVIRKWHPAPLASAVPAFLVRTRLSFLTS